MPERLPTGTVTFLFTDIEGSTRLLNTLGPVYDEVLARHSGIVRDALAEQEGIEVRTEGDSFFVVFSSAVCAVAVAVTVQRGLAAQEWPLGQSVKVRMGLHTGEARLGGDDYIGLDVHRAARIAAAAHGGQVLVSSATSALVATSLPEGVTQRDLGAHRLKDLDEPEHLVQLVISGLRSGFPAVRSLETIRNLPTEWTSFIGRQREVNEATELLERTRLLTVSGPGGTGKTRLAIRIATRVASAFPDGVYFVDLAPLTDPALVGPTVARTLGLSEQAERPIAELLGEHLAHRQVLLVLDNFEQVRAAAEVIQGILDAARQVKALVTSRSTLGLYGEQDYPLLPLALLGPGAAGDPDRQSRSEAVELFIERARAAQPSFSVTRESGAIVAEICVRLDGLPLAIELAASRVRLLAPAEILARLRQHLPVLGMAASNLPARQRTLHGAMEWSFELLRPEEQALFRRLAVFVGGCTLEAVDAVCNPGEELGLGTFDGLAALVEQSLVGHLPDSAGSRYGMLETIREYGRDRLATDGGLEMISQRHLRYFTDLALLAEPHFVAADQAGWLDRFEREHDNVRTALRHAVDAGDADTGLQLAAALWRFWYQRGYLREGAAWLKELLGLESEGISPSRAKAFLALGGLAYWLSDAEVTEASYGSAVRLFGLLGDREAEAEARYDLAFVAVMRDDLQVARQRFTESLALATDVDRADLVAKNQNALGIVLREVGEVRSGLSLIEQALAFFQKAGDRHQLVWGLGEMAVTLHMLGDEHRAWVSSLQALDLVVEARSVPGICLAMELISVLASDAGRHAEGTCLGTASVLLREEIGATTPRMFRPKVDVEATARTVLGDVATAQALAEGRAMNLDQAIEYARRLGQEQVKATAPPQT